MMYEIIILILLLLILYKFYNNKEIIIYNTTNSFTLGSFIGNETEFIEFKEYTILKDYRYKKKIDAKYIIKNKKWDIIVSFTPKILKIYFKSYISKYSSSFGNMKNTFEKKTLILGVADNGEVIGIPIYPKDIPNIRKAIWKEIHKFLLLNNILYMKNKFRINIIECSYDNDYIDSNYYPLIDKYEKELKEYNKNIYKKKNIIDKINLYKSAINNILNNKKVRKELVKYMKNNNAPYILINELNKDKQIILENETISLEKIDINKLSYWIIQYRTYIVNKLNKEIPETYKLVKPKNPYYNILNNLKLLSSDMVKTGIKFYIIKIIIPNLPKTFYIDNGVKKHQKRIMGKNGPITINIT